MNYPNAVTLHVSPSPVDIHRPSDVYYPAMEISYHRYVEQGTVNGVKWMWSRGPSPRGLVLAPSLIGGHALQQIRQFRPLVKRQLDVLSFNYAGHGGSRGSFSLQAAVENSSDVLDLAIRESRRQKIPLFGIASCFAAVPLLHVAGQGDEAITKLVLINALPNLRWEKMALDFISYWQKKKTWHPTVRGLKEALQTYREELLPDISHNHQAFGILPRDRIQWSRLIQDLFSFRRLNTRPLNSTPVLCVYGQRDRLLQQMSCSDWKYYEALIARACPLTRFRRVDGGHFLRGMDMRRQLMEDVVQFFFPADPEETVSVGRLF